MFFGQKLFEEFSQKMRKIIEGSPAKDIEKNIRAMMAATFSKMDLVTREEFDIQQELLVRTRVKLTSLEQRIAVLEVQVAATELNGIDSPVNPA